MQGETITIRALGPEDAHVLDRVRDGVFDNPVDPALAWRFLMTGVNEMIVALSAGEVVGFVSGTVIMHPDRPPSMFVNEVGVASDVEGGGVGTRLMRAMTDLALDRGCDGLWVLTDADNGAARALYSKMDGIETTGVVMYEWPD